MFQPISNENLRLGVDAWIPRLPTPSHDRTHSRVSSTTSIASLSERNYPHVRPLPSPTPDQSFSASSTSTPVTDESSPTGPSKTNAFFSSPFSIAIARSPPPPAPLAARSTSLNLPKKKQARDSLDSTPSIFTDEPISEPVPTKDDLSETPGPSRSQTVSANFFFGGPAAKAIPPPPVPPPNLEPIAKKKPASTLPGLSSLTRFFPSRSRHPDPIEVEDHVHLTEPTPPQTVSLDEKVATFEQPVSPRKFVNLRVDDLQREEGPLTASPVTPQPLQLHVPSPMRPRQASPEQLLALAHAHPDLSGHIPIRRETDRHADFHTTEPAAGQIIGGPDTPLKLVKLLGQGAFSSVWLAHDETAELALVRSTSIGRGLSRKGSAGRRVVRRRRQSKSWAKKERDGRMEGLRPPPLEAPSEVDESVDRTSIDESVSSHGHERDQSIKTLLSTRSFTNLNGKNAPISRLVAVKMMDRAMCDANDRTRISFVREVEVLRHISHPSIVSYLHSFTTPTHHCLVLEHIAGGELFDLINNDEKHAALSEVLLRRMFTELCRAVAWMHSVSLVHRDIKLENILLTCNPFTPEFIPEGSAAPSLALLPNPLLKLTDFGLSRFIDPENPLLATRCGSESYAAPEIVMAQKYDGRQTDAWACGVVLYALTTRVLPFDKATGPASVGSGGGSERGGSVASPDGSVNSSLGGNGRRSYLIRIAKAEYSWPDESTERLATPGLRKVVDRLLVRDRKNRSTVAQLWDEEWMNGEGGMPRPTQGFRINIDYDLVLPEAIDTEASPLDPLEGTDDLEEEAAGEDTNEPEPDPDSGLLMNGESIPPVAKLDINY